MNAAVKYLRERAESYASDARKFGDAEKLGRPIMGAGEDARYAVMYRIVAGELRKAAEQIPAGAHDSDLAVALLQIASGEIGDRDYAAAVELAEQELETV
jgi:hypothetical protein